MGRKLEQTRAENSQLRAEITRLSQLLEQARRDVGTFTMTAPLTVETNIVPGKSYDASFGPFRGTAVIQSVAVIGGAGKPTTVTARFRVLQAPFMTIGGFGGADARSLPLVSFTQTSTQQPGPDQP